MRWMQWGEMGWGIERERKDGDKEKIIILTPLLLKNDARKLKEAHTFCRHDEQ